MRLRNRLALRAATLLDAAATLRWRLLAGRIGHGARISATARIRGDLSRLEVAEGVVIGDFVHLWVSGGVTIGRDSLIAAHAVITSQSHHTAAAVDGMLYRQTHDDAAVVIGRNVWIASGAVISRGVTVGDDCIVGANAVVLADLPAGSLAVGAPARVVRSLYGPAQA